MKSLYTPEVETVFRGLKSPYPNFVVDIVEYPRYLMLQVYTKNIDQFNQSQKVSIAEYLVQLRDSIRALGVKCDFDRVEGDPPK